jgi:tRNA-uridine 2-sulfurtransferase
VAVSTDTRSHVIVGLSGGVDSAVAALLLQQAGHRVEGLFMKNWEEDDTDGHCAAAEDLEDARRVCARLAIPLHKVNFAAEYWDRVFQYFLAEYRAGRTPNPDVLCNTEIKFKAFLEHAIRLGAERIATGHYARCDTGPCGLRLLKAADAAKDQTYFLYGLGQEQLARTLFPLGGLQKAAVRRLAGEADFPNHAKKDSTGICFIGERHFGQFLRHYLPAQPGEMRTPEGAVVGQHDGLMFYTLGQRQGLGIGGRQAATGQPWYVVGKDLERKVLVVAQGHDHPLLFHRALKATQLNWISGEPPTPGLQCTAKTRYRQSEQVCIITEIGARCCRVAFAEPQWAMTPGQSVVFYRDDECLGGGVIDEVYD